MPLAKKTSAQLQPTIAVATPHWPDQRPNADANQAAPNVLIQRFCNFSET